MANELAPFGISVTVLVTGTFDTDIITDAGTQDHRDFDGPYGLLNTRIEGRQRTSGHPHAGSTPPIRPRPGRGAARHSAVRPPRGRARRPDAAGSPTGYCPRA